MIGGRPVVIPTLHWREGEHVDWHGNAASRMLEANAAGGEVCLTASLFDGWVMARSGFHHSANYRSVMCFGVARAITDAAEKEAALAGFVEGRFPGRWARLRPPTRQELKATVVLTMPIDEASAKVRTGPPIDEPEDISWPVWAGVLPVSLVPGRPEPAPDNSFSDDPGAALWAADHLVGFRRLPPGGDALLKQAAIQHSHRVPERDSAILFQFIAWVAQTSVPMRPWMRCWRSQNPNRRAWMSRRQSGS